MKRLFVLGASTIPGEFIVPRILSVIIRRLPAIELKVDISDSLVTIKKVKTGVLELGVVGTKYDSDEIEYLPVMKDDRLLLIAPPDHPLAAKTGITLVDLKGQNFINREYGSGTRDVYEKAFRDAGVHPSSLNIVAELNDTEGIIQAVEGGAGLSVVSELAAGEAIQMGKVVVLDFPLLKITRDFYIITNRTRSLSPDGTMVLNVLKEILG
jgi:DNA-binding transcriptional LysR family regulator